MNSTNPKESSTPARKQYRRPTLTRVLLRPEEAVLGGCKTSSSGALNVGAGFTCSIPSNCSTLSS